MSQLSHIQSHWTGLVAQNKNYVIKVFERLSIETSNVGAENQNANQISSKHQLKNMLLKFYPNHTSAFPGGSSDNCPATEAGDTAIHLELVGWLDPSGAGARILCSFSVSDLLFRILVLQFCHIVSQKIRNCPKSLKCFQK